MKFSTTDNILFTRRLAFLLNAGISLSQALALVTNQSKPKHKTHFKTLEKSIISGKSFSTTIAQFPKYHPSFMVRIIKAGEESGQLKECLMHVSAEMNRRKILTKKIISLSVYPCLIAFGTIALSFFLIFFIFPKIRTLFQSLHGTLPLSTRLIISFSEFITTYGLFILFFISNISISLFLAIKYSPSFRYKRDKLLLSLPLVGSLIRSSNTSVFLRVTGIMLQAKIPIHKALCFASESVTNNVYIQATTLIAQETTARGGFAQALHAHKKLFQETSIQLIEVGESSGTLAQSLIFISDMLDQELEEKIKLSMTFLEPLLMVFMGFIVGFISLSIISPIYEISQNLKH